MIGNPPYQEMTGGGKVGAKPIYQYFIENADKIVNDYVVMITPTRWLLDSSSNWKYRDELMKSNRIITLVDYTCSLDVFNDVEIAGGICYFLIGRDNSNNETTVCNISNNTEHKAIRKIALEIDDKTEFIRDNMAVEILNKVRQLNEDTMINMVSTQNTFKVKNEDIQDKKENNTDLEVILGYNTVGYIKENKINNEYNLIDSYKVITGRVNPDRGGVNRKQSELNVINKPRIINPGQITSMTYLVIGSFKQPDEAYNLLIYMKTKLFRFLLNIGLASISVTRKAYRFVPVQNFKEKLTDKELYSKYKLNSYEVSYIEKTIKNME